MVSIISASTADNCAAYAGEMRLGRRFRKETMIYGDPRHRVRGWRRSSGGFEADVSGWIDKSKLSTITYDLSELETMVDDVSCAKVHVTLLDFASKILNPGTFLTMCKYAGSYNLLSTILFTWIDAGGTSISLYREIKVQGRKHD